MSVSVTVVTPVFNGADHLRATIASVQAQTFGAFEHVVVDDGSTDGSAELVEREAERDRRIRLIRQSNQGLSAARNTGLRRACADVEFAMFLDDDDVLRPRSLELLVGELKAHPDAIAAHGGTDGIDGRGNPMPLVRPEAS